MTERRGTKALELWCRRITDGYPGVNVQNMTTSWRDGLAFCAMIHHFRPDLIDFDSLNKDDVYGNNELAFRTAAEHLGIPALLDAEDMASCSVPDRLSILTYLSQFYRNFGSSSPSRLALSRTKESSNEQITPVAESTTPKVGPRMGMRREICAVCGLPVFLAEKLVISRTSYHRTCFRCARCANQLTMGNYYETEDGEYCCETCPDEEESGILSSANKYHQAYNEAMIFGRENLNERNLDKSTVHQDRQRLSLSDEEKSEQKARLAEQQEIIEDSTSVACSTPKIQTNKFSIESNSRTARMRQNFMANHLLADERPENSVNSSFETEETFPDTETPSRADSSCAASPSGESKVRREGSLKNRTISDVDSASMAREDKIDSSTIAKNSVDRKNSSYASSPREESAGRGLIDKLEDNNLADSNHSDRNMTRRRGRSFDTASDEATLFNDIYSSYYDDDKEISVRQDTKDEIGADINFHRDCPDVSGEVTRESQSLVQGELEEIEEADSTSDRIFQATNLHVTAASKGDDEEEILEDSDVTSKDLSTDESKILVNEKKIDESKEVRPPVVPKRSNVRNRKKEKPEVKKSDVTLLSASGIDLSNEKKYPRHLNPFGSDDEDDDPGDRMESREQGKLAKSRVSTNPFGSDEDEEEEKIVSPPRPAARAFGRGSLESSEQPKNDPPAKRILKAPQINLNPFLSDEDEDEEHEDHNNDGPRNGPVPKPRNVKDTPEAHLSTWKGYLREGDVYTSNSSLASAGSSSTPGGTCRKKKRAPPPPVAKELFGSGGDNFSSVNRETDLTGNNSRIAPRARKTKPAPPPPMLTAPSAADIIGNLSLDESPMTEAQKIIEARDYERWRDPKNGKDEANRTKQSMTICCDEPTSYDAYMDKSAQGKWKRKKGPAPARPIPHRRKIKVMSLKDVKLELDEIEMQQLGLEKQGVRLEQLIRDRAESGDAAEETCLSMDVEELVLELFALVNEKNELFRRQAELMLLRRQQRLEEEHADIEYQIRCLLCQPEATKTDFDKEREETLIQRLVEIVERRNEIVECLEMDRRREVEEDRSINTQMGIYAAKNKADSSKNLEEQLDEDDKNRSRKSKKSKLKEKAKEKILRKVHRMKDADKDVDETEVKLKRQNKKKWF